MYFVYGHFKDERCHYVGCGNENRPWDFHRRNENWKKVFSDAHPTVIIFDELGNREDALDCEKKHIDRFKSKGYVLANKPTAKPWLGKKRDPELMKKMSLASQTPESKELRYAHRRGIKQSPELIEKRIAPIRGRKLSDEHKRKISEARTGNNRTGTKHSEETKLKMSIAGKNREAIKRAAKS